MAKQKGILKVGGTIDDLTFYETQDGHLVRKKGGISKSRIANDAAFARTRENNAEFGSSAAAGKMLRSAIYSMLQQAADNRVVSRITKVMSEIKNLDSTSIRGERNISTGIQTTEAKALLKNFNFNDKAQLSTILFQKYNLNDATGEISMDSFSPLTQLNPAPGSTHASLKAAWLNIDFATGAYDLQESALTTVSIKDTAAKISLIPTAVPQGTGTNIYFFLVEFFQDVNGVKYTLQNGAFNTLTIVEVK